MTTSMASQLRTAREKKNKATNEKQKQKQEESCLNNSTKKAHFYSIHDAPLFLIVSKKKV